MPQILSGGIPRRRMRLQSGHLLLYRRRVVRLESILRQTPACSGHKVKWLA
jgi:hypothetical protein